MADKVDDGGPAKDKSLRDWFAGLAGDEAFRLLTEHAGQDWMGSCLADAILVLAETKLMIANAMLTQRKQEPE